MKRVSLFGASAVAIAASMLNGAGEALASAARGVHRVAAGTKRARRMVSVKTPHNRSKYMPHIGAKEQARAKRCRMQAFMECGEGIMRFRSFRSAPTMEQMSKRQYASLNAQKQAA